MRGTITTVDGEHVDVEIVEPAAHYAVLIALLDAAGDQPRAVATTTHHGRAGFRVPRDLAEKAGLLDPPAELVEEPVKPVRKVTRKPKAEPVIPAVEVGGPVEAAADVE